MAGGITVEINFKTALVAVGVVLFVGLFIYALVGLIEHNSPNRSNDKYDATYAAEHCMSSTLKAPSTAKFPSHNKWFVEDKGSHFQVSSYVDAQNSFGAMIRTDFACIVYKSDNYAICNSGVLPPDDIRNAQSSPASTTDKMQEQHTAPTKPGDPPDYLKSYPVIDKPNSKTKPLSDEQPTTKDYYGTREKTPKTHVYKSVDKDGNVTFSDNPNK